MQQVIRSILAALFLLAGPVGAARADTITVGVEDLDYLPHYGGGENAFGGFARALLDRFAQASGHEVRYRPMPVERLWLAFLSGAVEMKYPDHPNWRADAKQGVVYSAPVVEYVDGVSVRPGPPVKLQKLGTVRGFTPWDYLDEIKAGRVQLIESTGFEALLELTLIGRVDGAYANVAVVRNVLARVHQKPDALVFDPRLPHTRSHYHLSSISRADVIRQFDRWMLENARQLDALKREYGVDSKPGS